MNKTVRMDIRSFWSLTILIFCVCDAREYGRRNIYRRKGIYGYSPYMQGEGYGYSSLRSVSPYPRCRRSKTKIELTVLNDDGTPVPYSKIDYVDAATMSTNNRWTNERGVLRFVVNGCKAKLVVYSKNGDPTYHEVDLTDSKTGVQKETVVLRNTANFLIYIVPTEDDKWSQEQVKFIYISGRTTGRGDAIAGSGGAAPLAVKVEAGQDLKLMLVGQTGIFPAYLHLRSLDITTNPAEATMALPPFSLGTKELGLVVGCNLADLSGVSDGLKLATKYVYYVEEGSNTVTKVDTLQDCEPFLNLDICFTHHFYIEKIEWKITRDYLVMAEFNTKDINYRGNCYVVDSGGKVKSTEIPSKVIYEDDPNDENNNLFIFNEAVFYIGCICKGTLKNYQSIGTITYYNVGTGPQFVGPKPGSKADFHKICTKCLT